MLKNRWIAPATVALALVASALLAARQDAAQSGREGRPVYVTNLPEQWRVEGQVTIPRPIPHAITVVLKDVLVPPVARADTTRLVAGGNITTDGFSSVVLSLAGQLKDEHARPGSVGAILVPDDELFQHALDEQGQLLFPLEAVATSVAGRPAYFASTQPRLAVGFPRYRVLFYNTTDRTATVTLYAYLVS